MLQIVEFIDKAKRALIIKEYVKERQNKYEYKKNNEKLFHCR